MIIGEGLWALVVRLGVLPGQREPASPASALRQNRATTSLSKTQRNIANVIRLD